MSDVLMRRLGILKLDFVLQGSGPVYDPPDAAFVGHHYQTPGSGPVYGPTRSTFVGYHYNRRGIKFHCRVFNPGPLRLVRAFV